MNEVCDWLFEIQVDLICLMKWSQVEFWATLNSCDVSALVQVASSVLKMVGGSQEGGVV